MADLERWEEVLGFRIIPMNDWGCCSSLDRSQLAVSEYRLSSIASRSCWQVPFSDSFTLESLVYRFRNQIRIMCNILYIVEVVDVSISID